MRGNMAWPAAWMTGLIFLGSGSVHAGESAPGLAANCPGYQEAPNYREILIGDRTIAAPADAIVDFTQTENRGTRSPLLKMELMYPGWKVCPPALRKQISANNIVSVVMAPGGIELAEAIRLETATRDRHLDENVHGLTMQIVRRNQGLVGRGFGQANGNLIHVACDNDGKTPHCTFSQDASGIQIIFHLPQAHLPQWQEAVKLVGSLAGGTARTDIVPKFDPAWAYKGINPMGSEVWRRDYGSGSFCTIGTRLVSTGDNWYANALQELVSRNAEQGAPIQLGAVDNSSGRHVTRITASYKGRDYQAVHIGTDNRTGNARLWMLTCTAAPLVDKAWGEFNTAIQQSEAREATR